MPISIARQEGESNEKAISRFKKKVQGAKTVLKLKRARFHEGKLNKRKLRARAVMREYYRAKRRKEMYYL